MTRHTIAGERDALRRPFPKRNIRRIGLYVAAITFLTGTVPNSAMAQSVRKAVHFATSADGVRIAYESYGKGATALVFVHGWSCDRGYWKGQLEAFSKQYTVVAVDLAGHGESGVERQEWTIESFGDDVAAVVNKLGLQRVILIGHSMGGDVIAEAARRLKGRVAGLVWADTYKRLDPGRSEEEVRTLVTRISANFVDSTRSFVRSMFVPTSDHALVERIAADMSSEPPTIALSALQSALEYSRQMSHTLKELQLPVVAINPDNEPTDTASMKRHGVDVVFMPGVGHFMPLEDPVRFNRILGAVVGKMGR